MKVDLTPTPMVIRGVFSDVRQVRRTWSRSVSILYVLLDPATRPCNGQDPIGRWPPLRHVPLSTLAGNPNNVTQGDGSVSG